MHLPYLKLIDSVKSIWGRTKKKWRLNITSASWRNENFQAMYLQWKEMIQWHGGGFQSIQPTFGQLGKQEVHLSLCLLLPIDLSSSEIWNRKLWNLDAVLAIWIWSSLFSHWYQYALYIYLGGNHTIRFLKSHSWHTVMHILLCFWLISSGLLRKQYEWPAVLPDMACTGAIAPIICSG